MAALFLAIAANGSETITTADSIDDLITVTALSAVDDDYSGSPSTEDQTLVIPEGGTDVNANDDPVGAVVVEVNGVTGFVGTSTKGAAISMTSDGAFSYDPSGSATVQALSQGATLTDTFSYTVTDAAAYPTGRFIRVMNNGASSRPLHTCEIEAFGPSATFTSNNEGGNSATATDFALTAQGAAVHSKGPNIDHGGDDDLNLLDGNGEGAGDTFGVSGVGAFVIVDFGVDREIRFVRVHQRNGCCQDRLRDFTVSIMADGGGTPGAVIQSKSYPGQPPNSLFGDVTYDLVPGATDSATVTVLVTGINDAPVGVNDANSVTESSDVIANPTATGNVLSNDTDLEDPVVNFAVTEVNGAGGNVGVAVAGTYGSVTIDASGAYVYTLNDADPDTQALELGQVAVETFAYTLSDQHDDGAGSNNPLTASANLSIMITGSNDSPVATDNTASVLEGPNNDSGNLITDDDGLGVDSDVDDPAGFRILTDVDGTSVSTNTGVTGIYGDLNVSSDGTYTYSLNAVNPAVVGLWNGQTLTDTFTYTLNDAAVERTYGRFIRIQNKTTTSRELAIGEIEAFASSVAPLAQINFDGANDLALSSKGATVESASTGPGHGVPIATIDGAEQTAGNTWQVAAVGTQITIDLGGIFDVNRVRVHQRQDCCWDRLRDFTVSLLADDGTGSPGAVVASGSHSGQPPNSSSGDVILSPLVGRFVRIQNNDGSGRALHIGEIEAFSSNVSALALASFDGTNDHALSSDGATVESATTGGGHGAATSTIDGSEQTAGSTWTVSGTAGAQITIDLGGTFDINRVRAHQRNDGCCPERLVNFTVTLLADDGTGNPGAVVASGRHDGQPPANSSGEVILTKPPVGRFIQVKNNGGANRGLHIGEIEAFSGGTATASFDGTSSLALASNGATVESATTGGGHGVATATIDGSEQTAGSTWTVTAVAAQITIDLGGTFDVDRVRVHQRNDSCCQDRLQDFTVSLLADDGTGNPGVVVQSAIFAGQPATNSFGELTLAPVGVTLSDTASLTVTIDGASDTVFRFR